MNFEKSCGAVIIKFENSEILTLLIQMKSGHWSFPKGHIEQNETEIQTAIREIKEETNLNVIIDTRFRKVSTYSPKLDVIKDVVFFIGIAKGKKVKIQETELTDYCWINIYDALKIVTFDNDREILKSAITYINSNYKEQIE